MALPIFDQKLGMDHIELLQGNPVMLTSEFGKGKKILTLDPYGDVTFQKANESTFSNQKWRLHKTKEKDPKVVLVSEPKGMMVCHRIQDGNDVYTRPYSTYTEECEWSVGGKGELYYKDAFDNERYLWMANDKLYVTNDGYVAEQWVPSLHVPRKQKDDGLGKGLMKWGVLFAVGYGAYLLTKTK